MRSMFICFIVGSMFFLVAGCGGGNNTAEMPANPAPLPKNPQFQKVTPAGDRCPGRW